MLDRFAVAAEIALMAFVAGSFLACVAVAAGL